MLPLDLLPIKRPLEDNTYIKLGQFYKDVIQYLIPDIIRIEANGIPVDLEQVQILEQELDNTLNIVHNTLANNVFIQQYLNNISNKQHNTKIQQITSKKKEAKDFLKLFNIKNKIHRSYVVNTFLDEADLSNMKIPEWSIKDLRILNNLIAKKFINDLISGNIQSYMQDVIDKAMYKLAEDKANIFNKSIEDKVKNTKIDNIKFNPASSLQKQELFSMLGIKSEKETTTGNPQWDRKELERLQKLLNTMIEDKEN